jgi:hypothetical protein
LQAAEGQGQLRALPGPAAFFFVGSRPPEDGSLNTLIFTLPFEQFARTAFGDRITVQYGDEPEWDFGILDKRLLDEKAE